MATHKNKTSLRLLASEKKLLNFPIVILCKLMTPGYSQSGAEGQDWQGLCRVPLNIATY